MSKNITIQEGGIAKQLSVDKLKTNLVGSGTCLWVPEDEAQLTTKNITENGTYKASDDGYYGYSEVTVSGIGTATGTGPDGETHSYTEDGTGGITDTVLPNSISVVTPPTVTTYADGATIDFSGMVVKAYLASGNLWTDASHPGGVIPLNELTLPVTVADASSVTEATASSDLVTDPASPIKYGGIVSFEAHGGTGQSAYTYTYTLTGAEFVVVQGTNNLNNLRIVFASKNPNSSVTLHEYAVLDATGEVIRDRTETIAMSNTYTYGNKTAYYHSWEFTSEDIRVLSPSPEHLSTSRAVTYNTIAWTILYGEITGGFQTIPVQYLRTDGRTLESSFNITVT